MDVICSRESGLPIHTIHRRADFASHRLNLCDDRDALQVAALKLPEGKTYRPHRHIETHKETRGTQEAWVVLAGAVEVTYYDLDDALLCHRILAPGDCTITFAGGHTYRALHEDTLVYEVKSGPYLGQEKDKVFIGEIEANPPI